MKNVYLIQFGAEFGEENARSAFLPYAIGCLAAYAWSKPEIQNRYILKDLFFLRKDFSARALEEPFLVGFSCYVWNYAYNIEAAKQIKAAFPDCKIFFGGHQIACEAAQLAALPFVDYLICYEGELPFYALLRALDGGSLADVPSLIYRDGDGIRMNPVRSLEAAEYVSPYLSGVFDALLEKDIEYVATIETVRGCPFACAYCDTALPDRRVKLIPHERTEREIDWLSEHRIAMCFCVDSNFGISERDVDTARYLTEKKAATGFPKKLDVALSKEKNASAIRTVELLHDAGMFNIATLSVQSTNPATLEAVGRKNLDLDLFRDSVELYAKYGIKPFTELILGLPCETYDSFCDGFDKLIAAGQTYYTEVYRCYILPNTPLARPETLARYGIVTVETQPILHHISPTGMADISQSARIVVATAAMPTEDWVRANLFAIVMQACYYMGALHLTADFIHRANGLTYRAFFEGMIAFLLDRNCPTGAVMRRFSALFAAFARGETPLYYYHPAFGDMTWFAEEGLFLEIAGDPAAFYADLRDYVAHFLPAGLAEELLRYQELLLFTPQKQERPVRFQWDFPSCFEQELPSPPKRPVTVSVRQNAVYASLPAYAREIVWYKRKYGGTICTPDNSVITVSPAG